MPVPNMKTFCLATVKPLLKSMADNLEQRLDAIDTNDELINSTASKTEQQQIVIDELVSVSTKNTDDISATNTVVGKVVEDTVPISNARISELCKAAWTDH